MSDFTFFSILFSASSLFGLFMGAYYGTMEYRIRHGMPFMTSGCFCPSCGHALPLHHQIPVLSFLFLRGRCHFCHTDIPARYPLTEGGFALYYGTAFLLFRRTPAAYLILWYAFLCVLTTARCGKRYGPLLKGLLLMGLYHGAIALLYLILYLASYGTVTMG